VSARLIGNPRYYNSEKKRLSTKSSSNNWGIKTAYYLQNFDFHLHFLNTYVWDQPLFSANSLGKLNPVYYEMNQYGFAATRIINKVEGLILKADVIYRDFFNQTIHYQRDKPYSDQLDNYGIFTIGIEYELLITDKTNMQFLAEYQTLYDASDFITDNYLFQSDIFLGIRYLLDNINSQEVTLGYVCDTSDIGESIIFWRYSYRFNSKIKYEVSIDHYKLSKFNNADNITFKFVYTL
jgi:hypothetical protein